jgi:hypothetical protein
MKLRRRPALPVGLGAIERELLDKCGSVSAAARALGVPSADLRRLVGSRHLLADAVYEGTERAIDDAVQVLLDGLEQPDKTQRLAAAASFCATPRPGSVAPGEGSGRHTQVARRARLNWLKATGTRARQNQRIKRRMPSGPVFRGSNRTTQLRGATQPGFTQRFLNPARLIESRA